MMNGCKGEEFSLKAVAQKDFQLLRKCLAVNYVFEDQKCSLHQMSFALRPQTEM